MALFVVRHRHGARGCPAKDPQMGSMLLQHLSDPSAQQHGIKLHSEAVVEGKHTLYAILEAADRAKVEAYMGPFAHFGSVDVWPALSCEVVVERRGC